MNKPGSSVGHVGALCAGVLGIVIALAAPAGAQSLSADPTSLDLGDMGVGGTASGTITLTASGAVSNISCSISGGQAGQFQESSCPTSLADSEEDVVNVDFQPTSSGAKSTTLTVTHDEGSIDIALSGNGIDLSADPDPINFGSVLVTNSTTGTTTLSELGGNATITACAIQGGNSGNFQVTSCPTGAVGGSGADVTVQFTPNTDGTRTSNLVVTFDPGEVTMTVGLTGVGTKNLSANPTTINFNNVAVGGSANDTTTLTATGSGVSNINCSVSGTGFSLVSCPSSIAEDGSADATVQFSPMAAGTHNGTLTVTYNPGNQSITVNLTGNGVEPDLQVSPDPINFDGVRLGESSGEITVTLRNGGGAPLQITDVSSSNSVFEITAMPSPALPETLTGNETVTLGITFTPVTNTTYTGTLDISSNDPDDPVSIDIAGSGLLTEMTAAPAPFDFGDVRLDEPGVEQVFTVENTAEGDFEVTGLSVDDTDNFGILPGMLPVTLGPTETKSFRVVATPQSLGAKDATVTVTTDIPGGSTTTLDVTANGIAPDMDIDPISVDLGPVDVQGTEPGTQTVTISNTGTATLEIDGIRLEDNEGSPYTGSSFWLGDVGTLPRSIPISSSITVEVFALPIFEGNVEEARLVVEGGGLNDVTAEVPVSVRGIDRHISVLPGTVIEFPPTYRNPEKPEVIDLEVLNTGEAELSLSMVMKSGVGAGAFSTSAESLVVPAAAEGELSRETIEVSFAPTAASGEPFEAELLLYNDDNEVRVMRVLLRGRGILPEMALTPGILDFGQTGAGVVTAAPPSAPPVRLVNSHASRSFTVSEVRVTGAEGESMDDIFRVDFGGPVKVRPMDSLEIEVDFAPRAPGVYRGELQVFVEGDPQPLAFVLLRGEAVDSQLRGGGCAAGGGAAGAGGALFLALVLGAMFRRRRAAAGAIALFLLLPGTEAAADPSRDLDLSVFRPAPSVEPELVAVEVPDVAAHGQWGLGLFFSQTLRPLVVESSAVLGMTDVPIEARSAAELVFSYALGDRYEIGAGLPFLAQSGDRPSFSGIEPAEGTALGDLAIHGRMALAKAQPVSVAASATVTAPTARRDAFAGSDLPTAHVRGIAGLKTRRLRFAANAGFRVRKSVALADIEQGNEITYGLGGAYMVREDLAAVGELFGALGLSGDEILGVSPLEAGAGVRYRAWRQVRLFGGLGRGLLPGIGSPDLRAFLVVSYTPSAEAVEQLVSRPEIDRGDGDSDGIANHADECPDRAEDKDGFQDGDGCPDLDNDGDNLADDRDRCPLQAEDIDGHDDEDGCPDGDNDGDGVPDARDDCPAIPEDKDGFEDEDGCDDADNDGDGIPDVIDQCTDKAETINANKDDDGCPDQGETLVMLLAERIEIFEPIRFRGTSAKIHPKSEKVLAQVAALMRAERDILRLQVVSHLHPRGRDQEISDERAEAVRKWLIDWGVEPERLESKGYGSRRPLVQGKGRKARAMNDRVEFIVLERKVGGEK